MPTVVEIIGKPHSGQRGSTFVSPLALLQISETTVSDAQFQLLGHLWQFTWQRHTTRRVSAHIPGDQILCSDQVPCSILSVSCLPQKPVTSDVAKISCISSVICPGYPEVQVLKGRKERPSLEWVVSDVSHYAVSWHLPRHVISREKWDLALRS